MTPRPEPQSASLAALDPPIVRVNLIGHGWQITVPDQPERVACETLTEATRMAYLCAARGRPCEVIIHDAYHRPVHHELIDDHCQPLKPRSRRAPTLA